MIIIIIIIIILIIIIVMIIIPIVIGAFGTVTKGLLKGLEDSKIGGRVETIQTTVLFKTARILRKVLETDAQTLGKDHQLKLMRKTLNE